MNVPLDRLAALVRDPAVRLYLEVSMSEMTDRLAALEQSLHAAVARVQVDVDALRALLESRTFTADDLAIVDRIQAGLDALDPLPDEPPPA